jgi:membrane-associated phospholipid phosphatase
MKYLFLLLLFMPSLGFSQQRDSIKRADVMRFADGVFKTYSAPARWKGKDWARLGGLIGGTAALTLADQPIRRFWNDQSGDFLDQVNTIGYHYGKPYTAFLFTGGFYLSGLAFKNEWAKETGLMLGTALFTAGLIEMTLKPVVGRARPGENKGNYDLTFMNKEAGFHSFPSGHASMAFTISFVMARRVKSIPLKITFYSLAASTAVCRLYSDAHWVSDVAFGSAIAWLCSDIAIKTLQRNRYGIVRPKKVKWDVSPYASGLTLRASF